MNNQYIMHELCIFYGNSFLQVDITEPKWQFNEELMAALKATMMVEMSVSTAGELRSFRSEVIKRVRTSPFYYIDQKEDEQQVMTGGIVWRSLALLFRFMLFESAVLIYVIIQFTDIISVRIFTSQLKYDGQIKDQVIEFIYI